MISTTSNKKGFTLIELIIAITIFTFLVALGVASYINLSVTMKKQNIMRKLYTEMEQVLSDINRWGKFYQIDYAWYSAHHEPLSVEDGNTSLALISKDNLSRIVIAKEEGRDTLGIYKEKKEGETFVPADGFSDQTPLPLTSENLHIQEARFFLFPDEAHRDIFQQKITTVFNGFMINPYQPETPEHFTLQTTFSSRLYASAL